MRRHAVSALVPPVLLLTLTTSCGSDPDPEPPTRAPVMVLEPAAGPLVFSPTVLGGDGGAHTVTVTNRGEAPLSLTAGVDGEDFALEGEVDHLEPGASAELVVRMSPTKVGPLEGTLAIMGDDPANPSVTYALSGAGRDACLTVMPEELSFDLGESKLVRLGTTGVACEIVALEMTNGAFEVVDAPELPFSVTGDETQAVRVLHGAAMAARPAGALRIHTSYGGVHEVRLEGANPRRDCVSVMRPTAPISGVLGERITRDIEIANGCAEYALIHEAVLLPEGSAFEVETTGFPLRVEPSETGVVTISFLPRQAREAVELRILTNDAGRRELRVPIVGVASLPDPLIFPPALDFGEAPVGCGSRRRKVHVHNAGTGPLRVERFALVGAGFSILGSELDGTGPVTAPFTVPPMASATVTLEYRPNAPTPPARNATFEVHHTAAGSPARTRLTGRTRASATVSQTIVQAVPPTDLLWGVDTTDGMVARQGALADALPLLLARAGGADVRMAVTTSDADPARLFACDPHPAIVDFDYADAQTREDALQCMVQPGRAIAGVEQPLLAAARILAAATDPFAAASPASGFVRSGARLEIVIFSDSDDHGSAPSDAALVTFYEAIKGARPGAVRVHAVARAPETSVCTGAAAETGVRLRGIAELTGGISFDLCVEQLDTLAPLFDQLTAPTAELVLDAVPDPATLAVTVDGSPATYVYDAGANAVVLNVPSPVGSTIAVDYDVACD